MNNLKTKLKNDFYIGAAVSARSLAKRKEIVLREFNSLTCENAMKFGPIHPFENSYYFTEADEIADFARENHMRMRGHTLVWHNQTSDWLFKGENGKIASKETVYQRLDEHMSQVIPRYKDVVKAWDVVNEVIADADDAYFRPSKWFEVCGEEFIEYAFRKAHAYDPKAHLFYNDYNALMPIKRDKIIRLAKSLKEREVPIHGIGIQGHLNIYAPTFDIIEQSLEAYSKLGLMLHVTELDISLFRFEDHSHLDEPTEELLQRQGEYYEGLFALFRQYKEVIESVTLWGVSDKESWLNHFPVRDRRNWPLLFDDDGKEKYAYERIMGKEKI